MEGLKKTFESVRDKLVCGYGDQSSSRTLIDCLDVYLTTPPYDKNIISINVNNGSFSIDYRDSNKVSIFHVEDCPNIQCCYEELLDFIINKALDK